MYHIRKAHTPRRGRDDMSAREGRNGEVREGRAPHEQPGRVRAHLRHRYENTVFFESP